MMMTESSSPSGFIPNFKLPASTGHTLEWASFKGKLPLVLVFLDPRKRHKTVLDEINSRLKEFGSLRTQVLVVAHLTAKETRELAVSNELAVPVLADASGSMARDLDIPGLVEGHQGAVVALVFDKAGREVRRFEPISGDQHAGSLVDALLSTIREVGLAPPASTKSSGSSDDFFKRIADEARVSEEEAPIVVSEFLKALAPSLSDQARLVLAELVPDEITMPDASQAPRESYSVEEVIQHAVDDSSIATGHPAGQARVVAEALRSRADEQQVARLVDAIDDEGILGLFEMERGELTTGAPHRVRELDHRGSDSLADEQPG